MNKIRANNKKNKENSSPQKIWTEIKSFIHQGEPEQLKFEVNSHDLYLYDIKMITEVRKSLETRIEDITSTTATQIIFFTDIASDKSALPQHGENISDKVGTVSLSKLKKYTEDVFNSQDVRSVQYFQKYIFCIELAEENPTEDVIEAIEQLFALGEQYKIKAFVTAPLGCKIPTTLMSSEGIYPYYFYSKK